LFQGTIYSHNTVQPREFEEDRFDHRDLPLPFDELFPGTLSLPKGLREMTIWELFADLDRIEREHDRPEARITTLVELNKRLAFPAACFVFGMLGLGLSLGSKKEARSAAFGLSIVIIFLYYLLLKLGEGAGYRQTLPPMPAVWLANLIFGGLAVFLLLLNHREAAFDPLDPRHYTRWLPRIRKRGRPPDVTKKQLPVRSETSPGE